MFAIALIDAETTDHDRVVTILDAQFETRAQAHDAGQALMDRLESAIDDYTQVYTYEVIPVRNPDTIEAHAISMINLFATAENRDYSITQWIMNEAERNDEREAEEYRYEQTLRGPDYPTYD
jgi:hypothetical protein